jgi:hypothetical protein
MDKNTVFFSEEEDNKKFEEYGLDKLPNYHCKLYPHQKHVWGAWLRSIYDFAQLIFKD